MNLSIQPLSIGILNFKYFFLNIFKDSVEVLKIDVMSTLWSFIYFSWAFNKAFNKQIESCKAYFLNSSNKILSLNLYFNLSLTIKLQDCIITLKLMH